MFPDLKGYKKEDKERIRLEKKYAPLLEEDLELGKYVSYVGNKGIPLLRLYRFKEAFAFEFVRNFLRQLEACQSDYIFDPFAGMGTTMFTSMIQGLPSIGVDKLPIATFVAKTIPKFLQLDHGELTDTFNKLRRRVEKAKPADVAMDVPLMKVAFSKENLQRLRQWKTLIDSQNDKVKDLLLLLFFSILDETSYTSKDGQFLRLKKDKKTSHPDDALARKVSEAEEDIVRIKWLFPNCQNGYTPYVIAGDTTDLSSVPFEKPPTILITSPPYVNRYDYSRSYCLELCFHFVKDFEGLKNVRFSILRSHIESKVPKGEKPCHPAVEEAVENLKKKELNNPKIPYMLIGYFNDMQKAIREWAKVLSRKARVALVVDNVRFEGELLPVDMVLSELAEEEGIMPERVVVSRYKGNSSQQMGKYGRIPVRESIVIWRKN